MSAVADASVDIKGDAQTDELYAPSERPLHKVRADDEEEDEEEEEVRGLGGVCDESKPTSRAVVKVEEVSAILRSCVRCSKSDAFRFGSFGGTSGEEERDGVVRIASGTFVDSFCCDSICNNACASSSSSVIGLPSEPSLSPR